MLARVEAKRIRALELSGERLPDLEFEECVIGALRAGVERVLLPEGNRKDARDLPDEVKQGLKIEFVGWVWEALGLVWPERWEGRGLGGLESRL